MLRKIRDAILVPLVMLLTLSVSAACGTAGTTGPAKANTKIIKVGWIPSVNFIAFLSAVDQWKSPDSRIELVEFKSSSDSLVALNQGAVDLSTVGYSVLADALAQTDMPLEYIAGVSTKGAFFVARKDANIHDWSDLKGKRLGGVRGSPEYLHLNGSMASHGLALGKDAKFTNFQTGSDVILALLNGDIDAAVSYEPLVSQAVLNGAVVRVPKIQEALFNNTFELSSGILARKAFVKENAEWTTGFLKKYSAMVDELAKNPQPTVEAKVYLKYATGKLPVIEEATRHITVVDALDEVQVRRVGVTMLKSGQLKTDMSQILVNHLNYGPLSSATGKTPQQLGKAG